MAPSRYDWKIVDWDVKPQHNQPTNLFFYMQLKETGTSQLTKKNNDLIWRSREK